MRVNAYVSCLSTDFGKMPLSFVSSLDLQCQQIQTSYIYSLHACKSFESHKYTLLVSSKSVDVNQILFSHLPSRLKDRFSALLNPKIRSVTRF
jgi:hypothetical protein